MHFDEPLFSGAKSAILFCVVSRHGQAIFYTGAVASYIIITTLILRHLARRDRGDSFTSLRYKKKKNVDTSQSSAFICPPTPFAFENSAKNIQSSA